MLGMVSVGRESLCIPDRDLGLEQRDGGQGSPHMAAEAKDAGIHQASTVPGDMVPRPVDECPGDKGETTWAQA
jgi:hypothetical protein